MKMFDRIKATAKATREGRRKAERDIDLVDQFLDVHEGKPPWEIMDKFFRSLGDDVRPGPEAATYTKIVSRYQDFLRENNMVKPQGLPSLPGATLLSIPLDPSTGNINMEGVQFSDGLPPEITDMLTRMLETVFGEGGPEATSERLAEATLQQFPDLSDSDVDDMARDHGHLTREDECPGLMILRKKIAERDSKK